MKATKIAILVGAALAANAACAQVQRAYKRAGLFRKLYSKIDDRATVGSPSPSEQGGKGRRGLCTFIPLEEEAVLEKLALLVEKGPRRLTRINFIWLAGGTFTDIEVLCYGENILVRIPDQFVVSEEDEKELMERPSKPFLCKVVCCYMGLEGEVLFYQVPFGGHKKGLKRATAFLLEIIPKYFGHIIGDDISVELCN